MQATAAGEQRGRIVPPRDLLINVSGPERSGTPNYVSVYIYYLRRKIEDDPSDPRYIHTRPKVGYLFHRVECS